MTATAVRYRTPRRERPIWMWLPSREIPLAARLTIFLLVAVPSWLLILLVAIPGLLLARLLFRLVAGLVLHVTYEAIYGQQRAMWVPAWVAAAAAASTLAPDLTAPVWALAYALIHTTAFLPPREERHPWLRRVSPRRRYLSTRERHLAAATFAAVALWLRYGPALPGVYRWALLAAIILTPAAGWWRVRRIRPTVIPELVSLWTGYVIPQFREDLTGTWRDVVSTPDQDRGILRLSTADPKQVARMDRVIEQAIDRAAAFDLPAGAINVMTDPALPSSRDVIVTLSRRPVTAAARIRYWEGPTLRDDGTFVAGYTLDGRPVLGRLWRKGGATNNLLLGTSGSGKGSGHRAIGLEGGASEDVFQVGIDGKYGAGMPELRDAMDLYLAAEAEWEVGLQLALELLYYRLGTYGAAGRSRWNPAVDPCFRLSIDEIVKLARKFPRYEGRMEDYVAQGRSVGCAIDGNSQRGAGDDLWSTAFRQNLRGNGTVFVGRQGDVNAAAVALQGVQLDLERLPKPQGYMYVISYTDAVPHDPIRWRYSVSRTEAEEDGVDPGPRTVEEWAAGTWMRRARLAEPEVEIVARHVERLGQHPDDVLETRHITDPTVTVGAHAVENQADKTLRAVYEALPEDGSEVSAEHIAEAVGISDRHVRNLVPQLIERELAEKPAPNRYRRAS